MNPFDRRTDLPVILLHNLDRKWASKDIGQALQEVHELQSAMIEEGHDVTNVPLCDGDLPRLLESYDPDEYIVFNWCEELPGMPHSEPMVAHTLERLNFSYTGSTSDVLTLSWQKDKINALLDEHGVSTPKWRVFESNLLDGWDCFPAIVKPVREHCSLGVTPEAVVLNRTELKERISYVLEGFKQPALVEDFIDGREFHVSLWGNGVVQMLPPAEMDFAAFGDVRDRLCTYDSKFTPGSTHYNKIELRLPAPLTKTEYDGLAHAVLQAYLITGCRDYARIDIRLREGIFYVLDVNPNADISSGASMACAAGAAGYSYGAMASQLVNIAARRHPHFGVQQSRS
jgi:D-alanine-D-alanine ligase